MKSPIRDAKDLLDLSETKERGRSLAKLVRSVQGALTPDLLKKEYREENIENPMYGHCYAASEALYHLAKGSGFKPCRGRDERGIVHWWLVDDQGNILDPTAEQYTSKGRTPPYAKGKKAGFLTLEPSKRAETIMRRIAKK
jgi:hypothetical protein